MVMGTDDNTVATPCPGTNMGFTFDNLTPGQAYTITLDGGLSFTGAASGTDDLPDRVTFAGTQASFTAPAASVSFGLGVVVSAQEVSLSTDLTGSETVGLSLLDASLTWQGGPLTVKVLDNKLPPTCVLVNPLVPGCPVCAMDASKCPEAMAISSESQFCMGQHIILCCLECPGSTAPTEPS
jgi:hypothetical protein